MRFEDSKEEKRRNVAFVTWKILRLAQILEQSSSSTRQDCSFYHYYYYYYYYYYYLSVYLFFFSLYKKNRSQVVHFFCSYRILTSSYHFNHNIMYLFCFLSGGFYSDDVGYVSTSCKKCPNGSFVALDKAPGKQVQDCKTCPLGR